MEDAENQFEYDPEQYARDFAAGNVGFGRGIMAERTPAQTLADPQSEAAQAATGGGGKWLALGLLAAAGLGAWWYFRSKRKKNRHDDDCEDDDLEDEGEEE